MVSGVLVLKPVLTNNSYPKCLKMWLIILSTFFNTPEGKGIVMQYEFKFRTQVMYYGRCYLKPHVVTNVNLQKFESNAKGTAQ